MPLKVIGAGMGRTGTRSLKFALEALGFGPCYHLADLISTPARWSFWDDVVSGRRSDLQRFYADFGSAVDAPAWRYYQTLASLFPNAKVILTVREPQSWFASARETVLSSFVGEALARAPNPVARIVNAMGLRAAGDAMVDEAHMIGWYQQHNEDVRRFIEPDRLLVYEISQGWQPICTFLEVAVPDAPFPHADQRAGMREDVMTRVRDLG